MFPFERYVACFGIDYVLEANLASAVSMVASILCKAFAVLETILNCVLLTMGTLVCEKMYVTSTKCLVIYHFTEALVFKLRCDKVADTLHSSVGRAQDCNGIIS